MKLSYFKLFFFLLFMQLFSVPVLLYAEPIFQGSDDSLLAFSGTNLLKGQSDVQFTEVEVNISMEKGTYGTNPASKSDEGLLSENLEVLEDLEDPFAEETPEFPPIEDPFEAYNRFMFNVNDAFFTYLLRPVATGYETIVPEDVRISIKNLFRNVRSPVNLVSSFLQGDFDKTGRVLGRFIINTTIGIGGLFDVAKTHFDIQPVNEDFDQALGYHGVPTGPYIVLPVLGPSTGRNFVGSAVDTLLNPVALFSPSFAVGSGITFTNITNEMSFNLEGYDNLKDSAVDPYVSLRDFNHQYREGLIEK